MNIIICTKIIYIGSVLVWLDWFIAGKIKNLMAVKIMFDPPIKHL